jgi:hypothetical protein
LLLSWCNQMQAESDRASLAAHGYTQERPMANQQFGSLS